MTTIFRYCLEPASSSRHAAATCKRLEEDMRMAAFGHDSGMAVYAACARDTYAEAINPAQMRPGWRKMMKWIGLLEEQHAAVMIPSLLMGPSDQDDLLAMLRFLRTRKIGLIVMKPWTDLTDLEDDWPLRFFRSLEEMAIRAVEFHAERQEANKIELMRTIQDMRLRDLSWWQIMAALNASRILPESGELWTFDGIRSYYSKNQEILVRP